MTEKENGEIKMIEQDFYSVEDIDVVIEFLTNSVHQDEDREREWGFKLQDLEREYLLSKRAIQDNLKVLKLNKDFALVRLVAHEKMKAQMIQNKKK
jgi:hypothetical protein